MATVNPHTIVTKQRARMRGAQALDGVPVVVYTPRHTTTTASATAPIVIPAIVANVRTGSSRGAANHHITASKAPIHQWLSPMATARNSGASRCCSNSGWPRTKSACSSGARLAVTKLSSKPKAAVATAHSMRRMRAKRTDYIRNTGAR